MNASLIAIYMKPSSGLELGLIEDLVREGGFQLQNRKSGSVTFIDEEGEFHAIESSDLAIRINRGQDTRFQFWESSWDGECPRDLYCRVLFKPEGTLVEFGEIPRDSDALLKGLWKRCCQMLDDSQVLGLVIDLPGATEEHADWNAFFVEGRGYDGPCPDILCVQRERDELLSSACEGHRQEIRGEYVLAFTSQTGQLLRKYS